MLLMTPDRTFYPSPKMAAQSRPETLAYLALINPRRHGQTDAIGIVDVDPHSNWLWASALVIAGVAVLLL